ncbi:unnamed protein product, partial [marine sediment metagenome]
NSRKTVFLATKSQEQISDDYELRSSEISQLQCDLERAME